ncbi:MAG TPA: diguanylate cyclase [Vicinamibacterales bacterium]|nr:diguanylate cyclase [Vicinamibacterales bacterium]
MRLITRNDASLAIGLIVSAVVVFQRPLHVLLNVAQTIEGRWHLDLVPALTLMVVLFTFHQYRKRHLAHAEARAAEAEAERARSRAEELERLMTFSRALAGALDLVALQRVVWRYLPAFAHEREFALLVRKHHRWEAVSPGQSRAMQVPMDTLESMADRATSAPSQSDASEGVADAGALSFPLLAGDTALGALIVRDGAALDSNDRRALGAAAALLAIALKNAQVLGETREHSRRDGLTGCVNHAHGLEMLDLELRRAKRTRSPLSILMFDIDHFKTMNDGLGHLRGDEILRALGAQLARMLRSTDIACRYGGDEFLIILPDTGARGAEHVAETLRQEIGKLAIAADDRVIAITVSGGVACAVPDELDVAALIERADGALYRSKRAGRNRFSIAPDPVDASEGAEPRTVVGMSAVRIPTLAAAAGTVLVVDDDPVIRDLVTKMLTPAAFTVLTAANADDAMALVGAHPGTIQLLLTDVVLPDLLGPDLAQRARRLRPNMRVLFMSGFYAHPDADIASLRDEAVFLQKPFTAGALTQKIRDQIEAGRAVTAA